MSAWRTLLTWDDRAGRSHSACDKHHDSDQADASKRSYG